MTTLRVILGDQLSHTLATLRDADPKQDVILMCEVWEEATYVRHHQQKIAFIFSAMRHFAAELGRRYQQVRYVELNDPANTGSFTGEVARAIVAHGIDRIVVTAAGEYRVQQMLDQWEMDFQLPVECRQDDRFLCDLATFKAWAGTKKQLRMEFFYRKMRQDHACMMEGSQPIGGKWNFDADNRAPADAACQPPKPFQVKPDAITQAVLDLVGQRFGDHFGDLKPFHWGVTTKHAQQALEHFIQHALSNFGRYQDAMVQDEPWMYHAHIGLYLNCGLLLPLDCIRAAEAAYHAGQAPLNAVEGFIRQILGWREFVRGIYWLKMPSYAKANGLQAKRPLPSLYWDGNTQMNCLKQCVQATQRHAYAHHIQRLMVLGNFALLIGVKPTELNAWFLSVYADAYEWVEMPNVTGMVLFADQGYLASKPYAAGGSYINKMSNYCQKCRYKVKQKNGPDACPFNYLYWFFLDKHRDELQRNPRMAMMYRTFDRMGVEKQDAVRQDSQRFLRALYAS
jgi:deoxyribodipyrimidine photolyase-related protein